MDIGYSRHFFQAKKSAGASPDYTTVYDAETQSCKLVTWEDYLKTNKVTGWENVELDLFHLVRIVAVSVTREVQRRLL